MAFPPSQTQAAPSSLLQDLEQESFVSGHVISQLIEETGGAAGPQLQTALPSESQEQFALSFSLQVLLQLPLGQFLVQLSWATKVFAPRKTEIKANTIITRFILFSPFCYILFLIIAKVRVFGINLNKWFNNF